MYPLILEAYEKEELQKYLQQINTATPNSASALQNDEKVLLKFLKAAKSKIG